MNAFIIRGDEIRSAKSCWFFLCTNTSAPLRTPSTFSLLSFLSAREGGVEASLPLIREPIAKRDSNSGGMGPIQDNPVLLSINSAASKKCRPMLRGRARSRRYLVINWPCPHGGREHLILHAEVAE